MPHISLYILLHIIKVWLAHFYNTRHLQIHVLVHLASGSLPILTISLEPTMARLKHSLKLATHNLINVI